MKLKILFLLTLLFVLINVAVYYITERCFQEKLEVVLKDNLNILSTHHKVLLETQKSTSNAIYNLTTKQTRILEIIEEANSADSQRKILLRDELHEMSGFFYKILKERGVLQYHFVLKDNESFYRAHKSSKFGDDLTHVRADFKLANETKRSVRGFTQGRTAHAFRNTFPLFNTKGEHIGAMEVSFSSDSFQWYLNTLSGIHSHFLVDKQIFDSKTWQRDDLVLNYSQAAENKNYMLTLGQFHNKKECIDTNKIRLAQIREEIDSKVALGEDFSSYVVYKGEVTVLSFLAIKNIEDKTVAWIVSYEESEIISSSIVSQQVIRVVFILISFVILYILYKRVEIQNEFQKQHRLVNEVLDSTDKIMFITDFKDVKYTNIRFRNLLHVEHSEVFNIKSNHHLLKIFIKKEGCLSESLLAEDEEFSTLLARTKTQERVVCIQDKNLQERFFQVSVSELDSQNDYLVTLSDITTMKKHYDETEKKAYIDNLTQVYNRNKFNELLKEELHNAKNHNSFFAIGILDIDKFKIVNDTYGHLVGDEVLTMMAQLINKNTRGVDIFARWGGEEFVILYKNTSLVQAQKISQKLRVKIAQDEHTIAGKITASFGLTQYKEDDTMESLLKRCDEALYMAKANGRNRVEVL